jgi:hypothetical protein
VTGESVDRYATWDAAYLLDALEPAERAEFETHLETCPECRARLDEARATADLLAALGPRGAGLPPALDAGPEPDTLLPGLLRRAARERRRRRLTTASVAAVAAACLVALVVVLWPGDSGPARPEARAMHPVSANVPLSATARLESKPWGTQIDLKCRYEQIIEKATGYDLEVIDKDNHVHDGGAWTLAPDRTITWTGGTDVRRERIAKLQITLKDGTPVLELDE